MTELRKAVLSLINRLLIVKSDKWRKAEREYREKYRDFIDSNNISIGRDGKYWYVYVNGNLIDKAPRRYVVTKTNPKPREVKPIFKGRW